MINAYYNGEYGTRETIKVPLTDRAIYFGDGIYEAAIGKNGIIYLEEEHLSRFFKNSNELNLKPNFSKEQLKNILYKLIAECKFECFFIYFQLTRNGKERSHTYTSCDPNLLVTVSEVDSPSPERILRTITLDDRRHSFCGIKTLNLLPSVIASQTASVNNCDESILIKNGTVTECAHSNVFIINEEKLITRPTDGTILPGITRKRLIELAYNNDIAVEERLFGANELLSADEVLITSSSKLCLRVSSVNGKEFKLREDSLGTSLCHLIYRDFIKYTS